ncbi:MAG: methyltransferase domain-containing protein [Afipia sp.]
MHAALAEIIQCPKCRCAVSQRDPRDSQSLICSNPACTYADDGFPVVADAPVLIDFDQSVVTRSAVAGLDHVAARRHADNTPARWLYNFLTRTPGPTAANARAFLAEVKKLSPHPKVLVVGGGSIGAGAEALYEDSGVTVIGSDIYGNANTDLVADGHCIPLADGSVHGVWIQAVLEHVLEPHRVAREIHRVLGARGVVYAETPFMQQVHEGAYDFSRFTASGHRWLFRGFDQLDAGATRGPGTVMIWSIRHLVRAIFRSNKAGTAAAMAFFWLRYLDRLTDGRFAADSASGVFFLGRKSRRAIGHGDIIAYYDGLDCSRVARARRAIPARAGVLAPQR